MRNVGLWGRRVAALVCGVTVMGQAWAWPADPTEAARAAGGPGSTHAAQCNVPYGSAPAAISTLTSGMGSAALTGLAATVLNQCGLIGAETLTWTDPTGDKRAACLIVPPQASAAKPLPLLTFLQGSLFPAAPQVPLTGWQPQTRKADLTGDPARPGFILLVPIGRNTHHYYPFPDEYAPGWDNWHRNLDRNSPFLNLDVAAIDQFIAMVKARGIVDANRQYMTGWSNGAALAQLYALNTPSVAAASVYSRHHRHLPDGFGLPQATGPAVPQAAAAPRHPERAQARGLVVQRLVRQPEPGAQPGGQRQPPDLAHDLEQGDVRLAA